MSRGRSASLVFAACVACSRLGAQGHGPAYGLSTPTLGKGGWSIDVPVMSRFVGEREAVILRPMISYGIMEDLQISASFPMPLYVPQGLRPTHGTSRMPANLDVEFLLGWRFHRIGTAVGSRLETTTYVGFDYPTDAVRAGVRTSPGLYGALVTGYASRTLYAWVGGLYRRYMSPTGDSSDHPGDVAMYSAVFGYRPPQFQHDFPRPDWRVFIEAFGERVQKDVIAGIEQPSTGGHHVFVGPTLLGLYGSWGISGGPVFPVYRAVNGSQPRERMRLVVNTTFWF